MNKFFSSIAAAATLAIAAPALAAPASAPNGFDNNGNAAGGNGGGFNNPGNTNPQGIFTTRDGRTSYPDQTQTVNINTSGCQHSLVNALACTGAQTFGQILVNRSAIREQRQATQDLRGGTVRTQPQRQPIAMCDMPDGRSIPVYTQDEANQCQ